MVLIKEIWYTLMIISNNGKFKIGKKAFKVKHEKILFKKNFFNLLECSQVRFIYNKKSNLYFSFFF